MYKLPDSEFKLLTIINNWRLQFTAKIDLVPSQQYLSDQSGKSRTSVYRILARLKSKGLI